MMIKIFTVLACLAIVSCTADENPSTFQNELLISGGDPDALVRAIDDPRYPAVMLTNQHGSVAIGIFQPRTGSPVLTVRDDNNDGIFDLLTYSSLTETGEVMVSVDDYGMDGQPDLILNFKDSTASLYLDGEWLSVDGVGSDDATVVVNGEPMPLNEAMSTIRQQRYD